MNGHEKSDKPVVSTMLPNNAAPAVAEAAERSGLAKGNRRQPNTLRTLCRDSVQRQLEPIRQAAARDKKLQFTTLYHHIYHPDTLRLAYLSLEPSASAGVDGQTWHQYGHELEKNLADLGERLKRRAYKAKPVRRVYIPKTDGGRRPLGVPTLEDKLVQRAAVEVLNAIYESDFAEFSYGFRPGRSQHQALNALYAGLKQKVHWVLDADIRAFFDSINHEWMVKFLQHRIADQRVVRLIQKWLTAGVLEDGQWRHVDDGTPQGGSISPLLANIYLHYVFDLWAQQWSRQAGRGLTTFTRFADDYIAGFHKQHDAEQFLDALRTRLQKFHLELHPDKTRLIEFGRAPARRRRRHGNPRPETFTFLGFTHICGTTQRGHHRLLRHTAKKKMRAKLKTLKDELRIRLHHPVPEVGKWLRAVVRGHIQYYGIPTNSRAIRSFRDQVTWLWFRALRRRSQRTRITWTRMARLAAQWLPPARLQHLDEAQLGVITRGRSRMR